MGKAEGKKNPNLVIHLMSRTGVCSPDEARKWIAQGEVQLGEDRATPSTMARAGDVLRIRNYPYQAQEGGGQKRLVLVPTIEDQERIPGLRRIQCGYHKCLTMFFRGIVKQTCGKNRKLTFRHFFHRHDVFSRECQDYTIASLSGHALDLDRFEDVRVSRVIRDPRDLVVSGYFYHKRGAERWSKYRSPTPADYEVVRSQPPSMMPRQLSLTEYLNKASLEEGLLAELEFRKHHFDSMLDWPEDDPRVKTFRYEDVLGHEWPTALALARFYDLPLVAQARAARAGYRLSAKRRTGKTDHIRNPNTGQWRKYFTPKVTERFNELYGPVLVKLGYPIVAP